MTTNLRASASSAQPLLFNHYLQSRPSRLSTRFWTASTIRPVLLSTSIMDMAVQVSKSSCQFCTTFRRAVSSSWRRGFRARCCRSWENSRNARPLSWPPRKRACRPWFLLSIPSIKGGITKSSGRCSPPCRNLPEPDDGIAALARREIRNNLIAGGSLPARVQRPGQAAEAGSCQAVLAGVAHTRFQSTPKELSSPSMTVEALWPKTEMKRCRPMAPP